MYFCLVLLQINRDIGLVSTVVTGVDLVIGAGWLRGSKGRVGTYHTAYRLTWGNAWGMLPSTGGYCSQLLALYCVSI